MDLILSKKAAAVKTYESPVAGDADIILTPNITTGNALFKLGDALGRLGQTQEACVTLAEVGVRYPSAAAVADAQSAMLNLGCS